MIAKQLDFISNLPPLLRQRRRRSRLIVGAVVLGVLGIVATPVIYVLLAFQDLVGPHTNLDRYAHDIKWFHDKRSQIGVDVVGYFPPTIPQEASNSRYFYQTPPGDITMQLQCVLPAEEVAALIARVAPVAKLKAWGSKELADKELEGESVTPNFRNAENTRYEKLPASYTIYVIGNGHEHGTDKDKFGWKYQYGIAVDREQREVIYWLTGWAVDG
jgi:hypothetical protein